MAIDVNRGAFVKEEWRWEEVTAPEVLAVQPNAKPIKLETNLDLAAARVLAVELLTDLKHVSQPYIITLEGVGIYKGEDFVGSPPTFSCNFPDWPVVITDKLLIIGFAEDYSNWTTSITIKGPQK